jgi:hypothetical protein
MPRLSRLFVRAALVSVAVGYALGALVLAAKGLGGPAWAWRFLPWHMELVLVGWSLQLAMGVGYWILPRFRHHRGDPRPAWLALLLVNAGVAAIGVGALVGAPPWVPWLGRAMEALAVAAFAAHAWPRVKPPAGGWRDLATQPAPESTTT